MAALNPEPIVNRSKPPPRQRHGELVNVALRPDSIFQGCLRRSVDDINPLKGSKRVHLRIKGSIGF